MLHNTYIQCVCVCVSQQGCWMLDSNWLTNVQLLQKVLTDHNSKRTKIIDQANKYDKNRIKKKANYFYF